MTTATGRFVIEMRFTAAVLMNAHGDWGDETRARIFDSASHAQAFLDTKAPRMKKGMRERVRIVELTIDDLRRMANGAAEALFAARSSGTLQETMEWNGVFSRLSDLVWDLSK